MDLDKLLKRTKATVIVMGVALLVLGVAIFVNPASATMFITLLLGWVLVITGVYTLAMCFAHRLPVLSQADLLIGLLELIPGVLILAWPGFFVLYLSVILGVIILVTGVNDLSEAMVEKNLGIEDWWKVLVAGILTILLGVLLFMSPFAFANAVMMIAGIALVFDGVTEIITGFRMPSRTS
ncbi:MAG: DUF308 domain-containing protein [Atopobiaceae bacterium]|jgi:uncharacterized membrane protein HdeD (DUF308 family)|nr:DUF308 domain-containing protein [Atopobiaceae bacterium]